MTYTYFCKTCETHWEENLTIATRDYPCTIFCKHCQSDGCVVRTFTSAPRISYEGSLTVLQRAGSGWNDVLNKVKKGSGRHTNIETR